MMAVVVLVERSIKLVITPSTKSARSPPMIYWSWRMTCSPASERPMKNPATDVVNTSSGASEKTV